MNGPTALPPAAPAVTSLRGVGPRVAEKLARLHIETVEDLLFHLPLRYEDRTRVTPIGSLRPGEAAVVVAEVEISQLRLGRRRSLVTLVSDGTGQLLLRLFHFSAQQQRQMSRGTRLRLFGEVRRGPAQLEMVHPEYHVLAADAPVPVEESLTAIYPTTEGLHQLSLRKLTDQALAWLDTDALLTEWLPPSILAPLQLPDLAAALRLAHRPGADLSLSDLQNGRFSALRRLAFEELLAQHLSLRALRDQVRQYPAPRLAGNGSLETRLLEALPFKLTGAQSRVWQEIARDLAAGHPMQRLLQGDVGSGKTVVAALAMLRAVEEGRQAALMAPTEILAQQHRDTLSAWLEPLGLELAWLSGKMGQKARRESVARIAEHQAHIIIGTHALFQDDVDFASLGLVITDEQHRFGVHQRLALREKGQQDGLHPHQLIMTATPIPRTLAMTAYADLDTSVLDELPPGRSPVDTVAVPESRRDELVERVHQACRDQRQAYWICTLIEESESLEAQAAADTAEALAGALPDLSVGLLHGRMKGDEKDAVMQTFKSGQLDLLVATTVVEVGVDVPNASLMIIENAERLGLAQLHQLRGRVGRGSVKSSCVLMYRPPLSQQARARLAALRESQDGFAIAQRDLELRGPGEVLGTRQTGLPQFRIADLARDRGMLGEIQRAADELLRHHPDRIPPLMQRWLGHSMHYGHV